MKMAWRMRRRSSRQRYVKNIRLLNELSMCSGTRTSLADNIGGAVPPLRGERIKPLSDGRAAQHAGGGS